MSAAAFFVIPARVFRQTVAPNDPERRPVWARVALTKCWPGGGSSRRVATESGERTVFTYRYHFPPGTDVQEGDGIRVDTERDLSVSGVKPVRGADGKVHHLRVEAQEFRGSRVVFPPN